MEDATELALVATPAEQRSLEPVRAAEAMVVALAAALAETQAELAAELVRQAPPVWVAREWLDWAEATAVRAEPAELQVLASAVRLRATRC